MLMILIMYLENEDLCRYIIEDSQGNGYANDMLKVREKAEWKVYMY